jgi:DNA-binding transcriptional LysR family regulator
VEFVLGNVPSDLTAGEADIAIRLYRPRVPELIARHVGSVPTGMYASEAYLEHHRSPASMEGLLELDLIGFDSRGPMAEMFASVDPRFTPDRFSIRTDSLTAQLAAARGGGGIAALQRPIAQRYPELRRVLPDFTPPPVPFWLVTHEDLRDAPHVHVAWEWLLDVIVAYVDGSGD